MAFIKLGKVSIYLIYVALIPIVRLIKNKGTNFFESEGYNSYPVISINIMFLAEIIGGGIACLKVCQFITHINSVPRKSQNMSQKENNPITKVHSSYSVYSFKTISWVFVFEF